MHPESYMLWNAVANFIPSKKTTRWPNTSYIQTIHPHLI